MIPRVAPTSRRFEAVKKSPSLSFRALRCHPEPLACHSEPLACHSERSEESRSAAQAKLREESRPGPCSVNHSAQNNIPRSARNDISWFPRVRQPTNMSNCFENRGAGVPPAVARASCPRAGAGRSRDRGRDARATSVHCRPIFRGFRVPVSGRTRATALESAFSPLPRLHRNEAPRETELPA